MGDHKFYVLYRNITLNVKSSANLATILHHILKKNTQNAKH